MFRSSILLFALMACGEKDTGFGVPVDTDNVDTADTQDTNETGTEDTSVSGETDCANGEDDDGDGLADCLDEDCDGVVSVDFNGKTGFCEFGVELNCEDGFDNDGNM